MIYRLKRTILRIAGPSLSEVLSGFRNVTRAMTAHVTEMDYDEYWAIRTDHPMQPRFPIIAEPIERGSKVLDVGCGDGACLAFLKGEKQINELGIDISLTAVNRAKQRHVNARVQELSELSKMTGSESFDYVIMSEVIEHVANPEEFVISAYDLARKQLILTFPNIAYWPHRMRMVFGRFPIQWIYHPSEHLRFWSVSDFRVWISHVLGNESVAEIRLVSSNGITWANLHRMWPNLLGNQIVVFVKKR